MITWQRYRDAYPGPAHTVVGDVWVGQTGTGRSITVYLPPSHGAPGSGSGQLRYPVVYMMDGQNLFDDVRAHANEWKVDETMERLAGQGLEAIVVGVDNGGDARTNEYSPFVAPGDGGGRAREFLAFLTDDVMPEITASFRASPERDHTFILGSSLGALFSIYAQYERPDVFGGFGAMSSALWHGGYAIFDYLETRPPADARCYVDVGTRELSGRYSIAKLHTNSRRFYQASRRLRTVLEAKEADPDRNVLYIEERGAAHSDAAWSRRLPTALRFLLS